MLSLRDERDRSLRFQQIKTLGFSLGLSFQLGFSLGLSFQQIKTA